MARTLGIMNPLDPSVDPLDPSNPIVEPRTFDPNVPSWFFEGYDLPPNPFPDDWGPLPPLPGERPSPPPTPTVPAPIEVDPPWHGRRHILGSPTQQPLFGSSFTQFMSRGSNPMNELGRRTSGGLPGMMARAGVVDPSVPDAPPAGGLVALLQEYLRNDVRSGN